MIVGAPPHLSLTREPLSSGRRGYGKDERHNSLHRLERRWWMRDGGGRERERGERGECEII